MSNSISRWVNHQNEKFSLISSGRLSRLEFLRNQEISTILSLIPSLFSFWIASSSGDWFHIHISFTTVILDILVWAIFLSAFAIGISGAIQRFHDLNKSGWHVLLLIIPFVNIIFGLMLLFKKGNPVVNQYGSVPTGVKRAWVPLAIVVVYFLAWIGFLISAFTMNWPFSLLEKQVNVQIMQFDAKQIIQYKDREGAYPASLDLLAPTPSSTQMGNFFSLYDAWANKLIYTTSSDGTFTLLSSGPDGVMNSSDDMEQIFH